MNSSSKFIELSPKAVEFVKDPSGFMRTNFHPSTISKELGAILKSPEHSAKISEAIQREISYPPRLRH